MIIVLLLLITGITGLGLFHTYIIYPWHMRRLAKIPQEWEPLEEFPEVVILMAAYNEEAIIQAKIRSIFRNHYPKSRLTLVIGTDACTDQTDSLIEQLSHEYPGLRHHPFRSRTGKPGIINQLYQDYQSQVPPGAILVLTDADAIFENQTLAELVLPFSSPMVAGVQAHILPSIPHTPQHGEETPKPLQSALPWNVSKLEARYMRGEMMTKKGESRKGLVIGGYGALMAMRWELFEPTPPGLLVDDFYWFARLLQRPKTEVVFAEKAIAYMPLEGSRAVQFQRKRRLGKGNLQNLWIFKSMIFQRNAAYFFISHKVLRWLSPWLLLVCYWSGLALVTLKWRIHEEYGFALNWLILSLILPVGLALISLLLHKLIPTHNGTRWVGHFVSMNLALALGAYDLLFTNSRHVWWNNHENADQKISH